MPWTAPTLRHQGVKSSLRRNGAFERSRLSATRKEAMNGPADTIEGAATAFCRTARHRSPQRRAGEDRRRNDRPARVLHAPGRSAWGRHHGLCRYARCARDNREFAGWREHDHDRKQNQLRPRGSGRQPHCRRDHAAPPRRAHNGVANARDDNRGEARRDRDANAASSMRLILELEVAPYSASGIGSLAGGSIWNVAAVRHVIEKLPTVATRATRLSSPIVFSAAA